MSNSIPAYDLRDIIIKGEVVQARPIQWDGKIYDGFGNDENGNPVMPISWVTTCPSCGNMVQFGIKDYVGTKDGIDVVHCAQCTQDQVPAPPEPEPVPLGELTNIPDAPKVPSEEDLITEPSTPAVVEAESKVKKSAVVVSTKPAVSAPALDVGPAIEVNIPEQKELKTTIDTGKGNKYEPKAPAAVVSKTDTTTPPGQTISTSKILPAADELDQIQEEEKPKFVDPIKAGLMKLDE
jgi:hypothetical protein